MSARTNIMIVDDHPIVRRGLAHLINQQDDLTVSCEAEEGYEALKLVERHRPDLAIVDLTLKNSSGMSLVKDLKKQFPDLPVLVVSMHDESVYAERALRAGARGYVMKHVVDETIVEAIRRVLNGGIYVSAAMSEQILMNLAHAGLSGDEPSVHQLSDRELEVFRLIGHGVKTREIAERLHVSAKTVETYRARIKAKLGLSGSSELTQYAVAWILQHRGI